MRWKIIPKSTSLKSKTFLFVPEYCEHCLTAVWLELVECKRIRGLSFDLVCPVCQKGWLHMNKELAKSNHNYIIKKEGSN
jgi:hypothetical protein